MRKFLVALVVLAFMVVSAPALAETKTLNFAWKQAVVDVQSGVMGGWHLFGRTSPEAEWVLVADIPFVSEQTTYTGDGTIVSPDNAQTTWEFVATAYFTTGAESDYSEIVTYVTDNRVPMVPINFTIKLQ